MNFIMNTYIDMRKLLGIRFPEHGLAISVGALALATGYAWAAQEHVVYQKNKAFSEEEITIKAGESVRFINEDNFAHNVYSLSDTKFFDLGSFGNKGERTVTFEDPGFIEIECAVHPDMYMVINVE